MISLHYYLDARAAKPGAPAPLKLVVCKRRDSAMLKTGISLMPDEWDNRAQRVVNSPRKKILNVELARLLTSVEDMLRPKIYSGELADLSVRQIRDVVSEFLEGSPESTTLVGELWDDYAATIKTDGTRNVYTTARRAINRYNNTCSLPVSAISHNYLEELKKFLTEKGYSENSISSWIRSFRAVWLYGVKNGKTEGNPFRGVKMAPVTTAHRDLTVAQLRKIWNAETETDMERKSLDLFKLSFLLRAINFTDLTEQPCDAIVNGRLEYDRRKTGKHYSVKIEPEALDLINRYRTGSKIFPAPAALMEVNNSLAAIAKRLGLSRVTTYWARHTLASLLFDIGTPMEIVSAVLGHSIPGVKVTLGYVNIRERQVDEAMRKVIDYVLELQ